MSVTYNLQEKRVKCSFSGHAFYACFCYFLLIFKLNLIFYPVYIYVREQFLKASSLLPLCESGYGTQAWPPVPLPSEGYHPASVFNVLGDSNPSLVNSPNLVFIFYRQNIKNFPKPFFLFILS